jgi:hypothetical protein
MGLNYICTNIFIHSGRTFEQSCSSIHVRLTCGYAVGKPVNYISCSAIVGVQSVS